ncbi:MAG: YdcF family protein [Pseudomonadota bacterium]
MDPSQLAGAALRMLLMPPANLLLLIAIGWLLRRRWPRTGRALSVGGVIVLLALSTNAGARLLLAPLENMTAPLDVRQATGAQAIVVLGAGSVEGAPEYGGQDVPDQVALVRLQYAAHLQHATGLPLLASGGNGRPGVEAKAGMMARVLREDFKTPVAWIEDRSEDTFENAVYSAGILKSAGVRRVLLVTHAMHMPRAQAEFARAGIEVVPAPTLFYSRMPWSALMLVPSASGLYRSFYACHEWMGLGWARVRGPVPAH